MTPRLLLTLEQKGYRKYIYPDYNLYQKIINPGEDQKVGIDIKEYNFPGNCAYRNNYDCELCYEGVDGFWRKHMIYSLNEEELEKNLDKFLDELYCHYLGA